MLLNIGRLFFTTFLAAQKHYRERNTQKYMRRYFSILAIICLGLFTLLACTQPTQGGQEKDYGKLPKISGKSYDGKMIDTSKYTGKVLIIDFWATWCPPCRKEIPGFIALQKQYALKGLQVVGVSFDEEEADHKQFAKREGLNYPSILGKDNVAAVSSVEKKIGAIEGIPTTIVVDRQGNIRYVHVGYADKAEFEKIIKKYL